MRIFPILLGAGAAAVVGVSAFASEAHPQNHGAQVSAVAQSATPGPGHGAAVSNVASQNRANDSDKDEVVAKTTPKPAINLSGPCTDAIANVKALRAQDAAEDAKERSAAETEEASETTETSEANDAAEDAAEQAAQANEDAENASEMTNMANAIKAAWAACRTTAVAHSDACSEAKEALSQFTQWEANRRLQVPPTVTSRIQQAIAQACA